MAVTAFAAEAPLFKWRNSTQQQDPWLITSQADLITLAEFLNSFGNAETFDAENAGIGNCHGY